MSKKKAKNKQEEKTKTRKKSKSIRKKSQKKLLTKNPRYYKVYMNKRRESAKKKGLCRRCLRRKALKGKTICRVCRKKHTPYIQEWNKKNRDKITKRRLKQRKKAVSDGICIECLTKPAEADKKRCTKCLKLNAKRVAKSRKK